MHSPHARLVASLTLACSSLAVACGSPDGAGEPASGESAQALSVMGSSASIGAGASIAARAETMAALPTAPGGTPTRYAQITEIPTLGGGYSNPAALRSADLVVGKADLPGGGEHAISFSRGAVVDLGTLGGLNSAAHAVSTHGMIAGYADTASGASHAFVLENGTMTDLGLLIGQSSFVLGMNDRSVLVGWAFVGAGEGDMHAAVWKRAAAPCPPNTWVAVDLGDPLGGHRSVASDVNASGDIVGAANSADQHQHAVIWPNGSTVATDLGDNTGATAINDAGRIVGNTVQPDRAVIWKNGVREELGELGTIGGYAHDIDESDRVVGYSYSSAGSARAVLWANGSITDLNTLIDPALGWELLMANAIGRDQTIVGLGIHNGALRGFVLSAR